MRKSISVLSTLSLLLLLPISPAAHAAKAPPPKARAKRVQATIRELSDSERSSLRFKLENAWNEVDLVVRNAHTTELDVKRQEKEMKMFEIFRKIPIAAGENAKISALTDGVKRSAASYGLKLESSKIVQKTKPDKPVPASVFTDQTSFTLSEDQLVEKVRMELVLSGTKDQLQKWMDHWGEVYEPEHPADSAGESVAALSPYLEWDPQVTSSFPEKLPNGQWKVHAQAYRFRDIRFPKLKPRDPLELLPEWARQNPEAFKAREPLLWGFVERTRAKIPEALPKFDDRGRFLLNGARMNVFLAKLGQH